MFSKTFISCWCVSFTVNSTCRRRPFEIEISRSISMLSSVRNSVKTLTSRRLPVMTTSAAYSTAAPVWKDHIVSL